MADNAGFLTESLDEKLSTVLINSGIQPRLKGFEFLKESVKFALARPESLHSITTMIYPYVSDLPSSAKTKSPPAASISVWSRSC